MAEYIEKQAVLDEMDEDIEEFVECDYALKITKRHIKKIPPADVRPVVRGRWEDKQFGPWGAVYATCSACRGRVTLDPAARSFCPSCGADMREP